MIHISYTRTEIQLSVFTILKQNNHDYTGAEKFGPLDFLFPLGVNVVNVEVISEAARNWFQNIDFDFDEDYFLPVGNPIVVAIVTACLVEEMLLMRSEHVNMLEWDRQTQSYVVRRFSLSDDVVYQEGPQDE